MATEPADIVYVVDDDPVALRSITSTLSGSGFRCRSYVSAVDFLRSYTGEDSGCVVLDLRMPEMTGDILLDRIRGEDWDLGVVVVSAYVTTRDAVRIMRNEAVTVLDKPYQREELCTAVAEAARRAEVHRGERLRREELRERFERLTPKEVAVLVLVVDGMQNKQIAERLGFAVRTIEQRRSRMFVKTDTKTPADIVRFWIELCSHAPELRDRAHELLRRQERGPGF